MEVAYRDSDGPHHRLMHRRIAEALAELYADQIDAVAPQLAMHFAEGDAPLRAVPYALRAASQAVALAAWPEAIGFYEQVLDIAADADRLPILFDLSMAHYENGAFARSTEILHMTLSLAQTLGDVGAANAARIGLVRAFIPQGRYSEVIDLAGQMEVAADAAMAMQAELLWGTALSLEGADLGGATAHLQRALELGASSADLGSLAQIKFELGSIAAQQGDLPRALGLYREALAAAEQAGSVQFQILAHNNLAYHLHLLADASAAEHAQAGLKIATDHGVLLLQPYILSTLGEIALAGGDLRTAEERFSAGLALAERLNIPERIAGLTANLGLVALEQHSPPLAIHRLSTALAQADALGTWHLAAQIRLWIAPLLPRAEARERIAEARVIAEQGGRQRLLGQVEQAEAQLVAGD
jgi:tetratricopeptide (TPR) repeat protein